MTMGVGRFATELSSTVNGIPVSTWVYPQERVNGFNDFKVAPEILAFFDRFIGPYPYDKLAHVQSKTRWGGLENAGNIFYFENVVNGKNEREELIAHETAHQWFGNSVTEKDWHHVWLSEGFATYLTHVYLEHKYGDARRQLGMSKDRDEIVKSRITHVNSIVDSTIQKLNDLLSLNTYQKAAWVLHMLRVKVGDEAFWKGVRSYYKKYQNLNALTIDFQREMEVAYGKPLDTFFKSWLYQGAHPMVYAKWEHNPKTKTAALVWHQNQNILFDAQLTVAVYLEGAEKPQMITLNLQEPRGKIEVKTTKMPVKTVLDPNVNLLFSGKIEN
jgi:aminopeptidase N